MSKIWDDDRNCYRFSYDDEDRTISSTVYVDDAEQWSEVVTHFLDFLSGVYGYDIKKFVDYKGNPNNPPSVSVSIEDET
jgi:hypothetical protein